MVLRLKDLAICHGLKVNQEKRFFSSEKQIYCGQHYGEMSLREITLDNLVLVLFTSFCATFFCAISHLRDFSLARKPICATFHMRDFSLARHPICATFQVRDIPSARQPSCATFQLRDISSARYPICATSQLLQLYSTVTITVTV